MMTTLRSLTLVLATLVLLTGCGAEKAPLRSYVSEVGIGVADLEASTAFFTEGLGMREVARRTRSDREEVVLESADGRGANVVLMHYTDGTSPAYRQTPGKLVFYVNDPEDYAQGITAAGGTIIAPPTAQGDELGDAVVGFARSPGNHVIEFVGADDADHSYFGALGVGVSDLEASKAFYTQVLGMEEDYFLEVPNRYDEYVLSADLSGGAGIVLMHYTDGSERNYTDNPVKVTFATSDPARFTHRIDDAGETVVAEPAPDDTLGGETVGYAHDPDGTLLEVRQTTRAYLGAGGLGVSDLETAVAFYRDGLNMRVIKARKRHNRKEAVLESADGRGSRLTLMEYTDGKSRDYSNIPGKLVYYVNDATAFANSIAAAGGTILLPPTEQGPELGGAVVGFARDPDGNLLEIVGSPRAEHSFLGAFGVGVSDLEAAKDFYSEVIGMNVDTFLSVTRADGSPFYDEYILSAPGGSALVLMHYTDGQARDYTNRPVKLQFRTVAPTALADAIEAAGTTLHRAPAPSWYLHGATVGYASDHDGTLLEMRLTPKTD